MGLFSKKPKELVYDAAECQKNKARMREMFNEAVAATAMRFSARLRPALSLNMVLYLTPIPQLITITFLVTEKVTAML